MSHATGILKHKIADALRTSSREEPLDYDEDVGHGNDPEVMGMDTAEVCQELSISSSNCRVMHHRVRMRLRACPTIRGPAANAL